MRREGWYEVVQSTDWLVKASMFLSSPFRCGEGAVRLAMRVRGASVALPSRPRSTFLPPYQLKLYIPTSSPSLHHGILLWRPGLDEPAGHSPSAFRRRFQLRQFIDVSISASAAAAAIHERL